MKHSWGFILLGTALMAAGWGALDTVLTSIDTRVSSSETRVAIQLKSLDTSHHREFMLIRSEASEMRNDIRYIRNHMVEGKMALTERR